MQTINTLSDQVKLTVNGFLDIGGTTTDAIATGTDAELHWHSMVDFQNVMFFGQLGTATETDWTASDDVLTITIEQATSATGAGLKAVKTYTVTAGDLDAKNDRFCVEVQASELDVANGFTHVRMTVDATDNNGTDNIAFGAVQYNPRYGNSAKDSWTKQYSYDQAPN